MRDPDGDDDILFGRRQAWTVKVFSVLSRVKRFGVNYAPSGLKKPSPVILVISSIWNYFGI